MPPWASRLLSSANNRQNSQGAGTPGASVPPARLQSIFPTLDHTPDPRHHRTRSHEGQIAGGEASSAKDKQERGKSIGGLLDRNKREQRFKTGKCMTCGSEVRWPPHLRTFRCSICLTINDLENTPFEEATSQQTAKSNLNAHKSSQRKVHPPITVERTQEILTKCKTDFLHQWEVVNPREVRPDLSAEAPALSSGASASRKGVGLQNWLNDSVQPSASNILAYAFSNDDDSTTRTEDSLSIPTPKKTKLPTHLAVDITPVAHQPYSGNPPGELSRQFAEQKKHMKNSASSSEQAVPIPYSVLDSLDKLPSIKVFQPLENYIKYSFSQWDGLYTSFRMAKDIEVDMGALNVTNEESGGESAYVDPSGQGKRNEKQKSRDSPTNRKELQAFYSAISTAGVDIPSTLRAAIMNENARYPADVKKYLVEGDEKAILRSGSICREFTIDIFDSDTFTALAKDLDEARDHLERTLLKSVENLLKRPGRPLTKVDDARVLLIFLSNPSLRHSKPLNTLSMPLASKERKGPGQHSGIIKRMLGLLAHLPNDVHRQVVIWLAHYPEGEFRGLVELIGSFITYRITRAMEKADCKKTGPKKEVIYQDDWQIRAACRVFSLLYAANIMNSPTRARLQLISSPPADRTDGDISAGLIARQQAAAKGHIVPISVFYISMLDYVETVADFELWEKTTKQFTFCQYPFTISMGSKIAILEYDAKRQMGLKARQAYIASLTSGTSIDGYFNLRVRRDCLVEDSLKGISEAASSASEDIKKGLRIEFAGEEGVDVGGLRKEWFLLLIRDVFDPNHGLFLYDDESHLCFFNPFSFEASEQFFLVGVLLGLAIYNSTILDVALPLVVYKKLVAARPVGAPVQHGPHQRLQPQQPPIQYTLDDLAVLNPALAQGLRQLLEFEGDVETTYCREFVADIERYGQMIEEPLINDGKAPKSVTNKNRREFVDLYIRYLLERSVARQFEPFKRGFYTICGGNAFTLFHPEEIELLIRGSDEPLDIKSLFAVAIHEGWRDHGIEPAVRWFWEFFEKLDPKKQRMMLSFITGSDRIPAMGMANLVLKIVYAGPDCERYPIARTCFNALSLYDYSTKGKLERMVWRAVVESEGFGLK